MELYFNEARAPNSNNDDVDDDGWVTSDDVKR